jgi:hypothetical protein
MEKAKEKKDDARGANTRETKHTKAGAREKSGEMTTGKSAPTTKRMSSISGTGSKRSASTRSSTSRSKIARAETARTGSRGRAGQT